MGGRERKKSWINFRMTYCFLKIAAKHIFSIAAQFASELHLSNPKQEYNLKQWLINILFTYNWNFEQKLIQVIGGRPNWLTEYLVSIIYCWWILTIAPIRRFYPEPKLLLNISSIFSSSKTDYVYSRCNFSVLLRWSNAIKTFRKGIEKLIHRFKYLYFFIEVCQFYNHFVLICHFTSISSNFNSISSHFYSISSSQ